MRTHYEHLRRLILRRFRGGMVIAAAVSAGSALGLHDRAGNVITDRAGATIYTRV